MFDAIPSERSSRAHTSLTTDCAAVLGLTIDDFARAMALAREGGDAGDIEAAGSAMLQIAERRERKTKKRGRKATDDVKADAFRHGRRRARDADSRLRSELARLGDDLSWQSQVLGDAEFRPLVAKDRQVRRVAKQLGVRGDEALRRMNIERSLREMAWQRWPAKKKDSGGAWRYRTQFVREHLAALGYWPDLSQQLYLPAPPKPVAATTPRSAPHRVQFIRRDIERQMAFTGEGWRVAA